MKEGTVREVDDVVRDKQGVEREEGESPSSSRKVIGAHTFSFESVSSLDNKEDYYDVPLSGGAEEKGPNTKDEELQKKKSEEPFLSCIEPFMRRFEENLHHEFAYMDKLQNLCIVLQEENKSLKEEIDNLKDFIFSAKLSQSASEHKEIACLHNKVHTLQAALRIHLLQADEYKKELDDARHLLLRRTRAKVKKGQLFELIIAQKPQDVSMSSCATPFQDDSNVGSCPICLEEFDIASGWYTLNCKHRYHLVCLAQVMPTRTRCCVCNQELHKLLYEIFGMANKYPDDARLWDAQTGQPVDFTAEEDIRAVVNEIEESQETEQEAEEDEDEGEGIILVQAEYIADGNSETAGNSQLSEDHDVQNDSQAGNGDEEEGDDEGTTDQDREDDEEYTEESSYVTSSEEEEDPSSSEEEEEDPNDPDYTPSQ